MKVLGFLNLRRISGQIAALVVASIVMLHLIITAVFLMERRDPPDPFMHDGNAHLAAAVQLLGTAPASERPHLIADIARAFPQLDIEELPPGSAASPSEPQGFDLHRLRRRLGPDYRIFVLTPNGVARRIGIALPDGTAVSADVAPDRHSPPFWGGPWMMTLSFAVISVTLLGLWAARSVSAPLSAFAKAAESFSLNSATAPLPERGPEEIRFVA